MGYPEPNSQTNNKNLGPITLLEVANSIKKLKQDSGKGLDGLSKAHLTEDTCRALRVLFNMYIMSGITPSDWDLNRTKLILKEGKDRGIPGNYRQITISSVLSRTFWRIIDRKLRILICWNARQKGFVQENGCYNNIQTLKNLI